jgi:hypothetical protein
VAVVTQHRECVSELSDVVSFHADIRHLETMHHENDGTISSQKPTDRRFENGHSRSDETPPQ